MWAEPELAVARAILINGPISRTDIAERLGLSQPTLTRLVKPLLASGWAEELTSRRTEGAGRPSRPLVVRASDLRFVGVKLTGGEAFGVLVDIRAEELGNARAPLLDRSPEGVADVVADVIGRLRGASSTPVAAVGVSLGGSTCDGRTVDVAAFLDWEDVPLADLLERRLGVDVVIENDVIALTAAEHWFGEARGLHDFAVVTIGAGVGLGLVRRDEVVRSRDAGLGPAGHIPLDPTGPICSFGHRGCSMAMLTISSMCAQFAASSGTSLSYAELVALGRSGDPRAVAILTAAGVALGRLLALVSNLALVETIVIAGEGLSLLEVAGDAMRAELAANRHPTADPIDLRIDRTDFARWARGAGAVAIQRALPAILRSESDESERAAVS